METNIFEFLHPRYKIEKPIRLIELFAGVGSQAMALRDLGVKFEHHRIVEFDKYAIKSYNAIHDTEFETLDMTKVTASDLSIVDTNTYEYIMTYSFPCQDLSKAGHGRGMEKGSGTRSGLLWEVERLLKECDELPQILLMENVPDVIGTKNIKHFNEWQKQLEQLGYSNYVECLNAKEYGIPQSRNRCFMVSILGDYYYEFPRKEKLKLLLKDMLEKEVDDRYYLSNKQVELFKNSSYEQSTRRIQEKNYCDALTARDYKDPKCVVVGSVEIGTNESNNRIYDKEGLSPTLDTMQGGHRQLKVVCNVNPSGRGLNGNVYEGDVSPTITTNKGEGLKIVEPLNESGGCLSLKQLKKVMRSLKMVTM